MLAKQISLDATGFEFVAKRTRKGEFLDEINLMVPRAELVGLIEPHAPLGKIGRPPFAVVTMLRIHLHSNNALVCLAQPSSEPRMTPRCTVSLQGSRLASPDCLTNPTSCGFATCSKNTT